MPRKSKEEKKRKKMAKLAKQVMKERADMRAQFDDVTANDPDKTVSLDSDQRAYLKPSATPTSRTEDRDLYIEDPYLDIDLIPHIDDPIYREQEAAREERRIQLDREGDAARKHMIPTSPVYLESYPALPAHSPAKPPQNPRDHTDDEIFLSQKLAYGKVLKTGQPVPSTQGKPSESEIWTQPLKKDPSTPRQELCPRLSPRNDNPAGEFELTRQNACGPEEMRTYFNKLVQNKKTVPQSHSTPYPSTPPIEDEDLELRPEWQQVPYKRNQNKRGQLQFREESDNQFRAIRKQKETTPYRNQSPDPRILQELHYKPPTYNEMIDDQERTIHPPGLLETNQQRLYRPMKVEIKDEPRRRQELPHNQYGTPYLDESPRTQRAIDQVLNEDSGRLNRHFALADATNPQQQNMVNPISQTSPTVPTIPNNMTVNTISSGNPNQSNTAPPPYTIISMPSKLPDTSLSFSNKFDESWDAFITRWQDQCMALSLPKPNWSRLLSLYLSEGALAILQELKEDDPSLLDDFDRLSGRLGQRFQKSKGLMGSSALQNRVQQPGESIGAFYLALKELLKASYPTMDSTARDELGRDFFISGLRDIKTKGNVLRKQPGSLAKAYELAESNSFTSNLLARETARQTIQETQVKAKIAALQVRQNDNNDLQDMRQMIQQLIQLNKQQMERMDKYAQQSQNVESTRQTPNRHQATPRTPEAYHKQTEWDSLRARPSCYYCNMVGHIARNCMKKQRDEDRRGINMARQLSQEGIEANTYYNTRYQSSSLGNQNQPNRFNRPRIDYSPQRGGRQVRFAEQNGPTQQMRRIQVKTDEQLIREFRANQNSLNTFFNEPGKRKTGTDQTKDNEEMSYEGSKVDQLAVLLGRQNPHSNQNTKKPRKKLQVNIEPTQSVAREDEMDSSLGEESSHVARNSGGFTYTPCENPEMMEWNNGTNISDSSSSPINKTSDINQPKPTIVNKSQRDVTKPNTIMYSRTASQLMRSFTSISPITWILIGIAMIIPATNGITPDNPMVCKHPHTSPERPHYFKYPDPIVCKKPDTKTSSTRKVQLEIYKENTVRYKSKAYLCQKRQTTFSTLVYLFNDERRIKSEKNMLSVSVKECLTMINQKKCSIGELQEKGGILSTFNQEIPEYRWCCTWRKNEVRNCDVLSGAVYMIHGASTMESTLTDVSTCNYTHGNCVLPNEQGVVIWDVDNREQCQQRKWFTANGTYHDNGFWISDERDLALSFITGNDSNQQTCPGNSKLNRLGLRTDQGLVVYPLRYGPTDTIIKRPHNLTNLTIPMIATNETRTKISRHNTLVSYLNAVIESVDAKSTSQDQAIFFDAYQAICQHSQLSIEIFKRLMTSNPTHVVRYLLGDKKLIAYSEPDGVVISTCTILNPGAYKIKPMDQQCYDRIPISFIHLNKSFNGWLSASDQVIYDTAKPMACSLARSHLVKINGTILIYDHRTGLTRELSHQYNLDFPPMHMNLNNSHLAPITIYGRQPLVNWGEANDADFGLNQVLTTLRQEQMLWEHSNDFFSPTGDNSTGHSTDGLLKSIFKHGMFRFKSLREKLYHLWDLMINFIVTAAIIGAIILRCLKQRVSVKDRHYSSDREVKDYMAGLTDTELEEMTKQLPIRTLSGNIYIPLVIKDSNFRALLDSGASANCLSVEWAAKLNLPLEKTKCNISSVTGETVTVTSKTIAVVEIANKRIPLEFLVIDKITNKCIIGLTALNAIGQLTLDLENNQMHIQDETVPLYDTDLIDDGAFRLQQNIDIQPGETCIVSAPTPFNDGRPILVEPLDLGHTQQKPAITVAHLGRIQTHLRNPTSLPIRLLRGIKIANTETVDAVYSIPEEGEELVTGILKDEDKNQDPITLIKIGWENVPDGAKERVKDLFEQYREVFTVRSLKDLPRIPYIQHVIETKTDEPIAPQQYPIPRHLLPVAREHLKELIENELVRPSTSAYSSPFLLVKKKTGEYRGAVDYRKLNEKTVPQNTNLPCMEDLFSNMGGTNLFSSMDWHSGYWQVGLEENSAKKAAFNLLGHHLEWLVTPFGLSYAPATFNRVATTLAAGMEPTDISFYLDDFLVHTNDFEKHYQVLSNFLRRIKEFGAKLKPSKCAFFQTRTTFLGHQVSADGIHPTEENMQKIRDITSPTTRRQVRSLLGLLSFYRKFIPQFSKTARSIIDLISKDASFTWGATQEEALETLKQSITSFPCLALPIFEKPFSTFLLATDASAINIGAVLMQRQDNTLRPIAWHSKRLNACQSKMSNMDRECYAILNSLNRFRNILLSNKVVVITDCMGAKELLKNQKIQNGRRLRWCLLLQEYDIEFKHVKGSLNNVADFLSRLDEPEDSNSCESTNSDTDNIGLAPKLRVTHNASENQVENNMEETTNAKEGQLLASTIDECYQSNGQIHCLQTMRQHTEKDVYLGPILRYKQDGTFNEDMNHAMRNLIKTAAQQFELISNLLWVKGKSDGHFCRRLAVPQVLRTELIWLYHNPPAGGGHRALSSCYNMLSERYWWRRMYSQVKDYVDRCETCLAGRKQQSNPNVPLSVNIPTKRFARLCVDHMGPMRTSKKGNKYILAAVDLMTRFKICIPTPDATAETTAEALYTHVFMVFGMPDTLYTDNGPAFRATLTRHLCRLLDIKNVFTAPYSSQSNGAVERSHTETLKHISAYLDSNDHSSWDTFVSSAAFVSNITVNKTLGDSPFFLMFGTAPKLPSDKLFTEDMGTEETIPSYVENLITGLKISRKSAMERLEKMQLNYKDQFDKNAKPKDINIGSLVYMEAVKLGGKNMSTKLCRKWIGPYRVTDISGPICLIVPMNDGEAEPKKCHQNKLRIYNKSYYPHNDEQLTKEWKDLPEEITDEPTRTDNELLDEPDREEVNPVEEGAYGYEEPQTGDTNADLRTNEINESQQSQQVHQSHQTLEEEYSSLAREAQNAIYSSDDKIKNTAMRPRRSKRLAN